MINFFLKYQKNTIKTSVKMTLLMLVTLPFLLATLAGQSWPVAKCLRKEMTAYSIASGIAEEVVSISLFF